MYSSAVLVLVGREESLADLHRRLEKILNELKNEQTIIIVFPKRWHQQTPVRVRQEFFALLYPIRKRVLLACHERSMALVAEDKGMDTAAERSILGAFLIDHSERTKALRHFAADKWQEWMHTVWKRMHALSAHKVSVWLFLVLSAGLLLTVLFVSLPSARIKIWPRQSLVSHTANIRLTASGASVVDASGSVIRSRHVLPLLSIHSDIQHTIEFAEISKKFLGENAKVEMSFVNETEEEYSFRKGTRIANQAGMIFRILESIIIPAATPLEPGVKNVAAEAAPKDLYDQIIGERGNVPAGVKWEVLGLPVEERNLVYARNNEAATGGVSKYGTELHEKDLELAQKQLEQELLQTAKVHTEREVNRLSESVGEEYVVLQYDVLTNMSFSGFVLPTAQIGQSLSSVPVQGDISYEVLAYSKDALLELLLPGLMEHIEEEQELIPETAVKEGISVHVIEYDDHLQWVKITAELTGKQRAMLSASTPGGRTFNERIREAINGKTVDEAERIIQNFSEVEKVQISLWPPWRRELPTLMSNIVLIPQE